MGWLPETQCDMVTPPDLQESYEIDLKYTIGIVADMAATASLILRPACSHQQYRGTETPELAAVWPSATTWKSAT